jgi:uncharacterized membrane protein YraQ (UPF0718 family)/copper chaperone CopZ
MTYLKLYVTIFYIYEIKLMIETFFYNLWQVFLDLSPSLLLGLMIAGSLHAFLPKVLTHSGLEQPNFISVLRAALIGVPLPLCSCGVIPASLALRNAGASKGATIAFLISTPQTGVDSILVSASMLGLPFAIFKVISAFISGLIGGILVNYFTLHNNISQVITPVNSISIANSNRILNALHYAVFDLLGAIYWWIIGGIIAAALITTLIPPDYFTNQTWTQGILGMLIALAISVPLYVCTTGSVPIAASLIAAGMPPSTALVFLMAGPATNVATIGSIYQVLGGRVLFLYLGTVIVTSLIFGWSFDFVLANTVSLHHQHIHAATLIDIAAALLVIGLLLFLFIRYLIENFMQQTTVQSSDVLLKVNGMTCQHCVARVKSALEKCESVQEAIPNLSTGIVRIHGIQPKLNTLIQAVEQAGYKAYEHSQ